MAKFQLTLCLKKRDDYVLVHRYFNTEKEMKEYKTPEIEECSCCYCYSGICEGCRLKECMPSCSSKDDIKKCGNSSQTTYSN